MRHASSALSTPKYEGKRVSRRDLEEETLRNVSDDGDLEDTRDSGSPAPDAFRAESSTAQCEHPELTSIGIEEEFPQPQGAVKSDLASILRASQEQSRRKGKAVARQMVSDRVPDFHKR